MDSNPFPGECTLCRVGFVRKPGRQNWKMRPHRPGPWNIGGTLMEPWRFSWKGSFKNKISIKLEENGQRWPMTMITCCSSYIRFARHVSSTSVCWHLVCQTSGWQIVRPRNWCPSKLKWNFKEKKRSRMTWSSIFRFIYYVGLSSLRKSRGFSTLILMWWSTCPGRLRTLQPHLSTKILQSQVGVGKYLNGFGWNLNFFEQDE